MTASVGFAPLVGTRRSACACTKTVVQKPSQVELAVAWTWCAIRSLTSMKAVATVAIERAKTVSVSVAVSTVVVVGSKKAKLASSLACVPLSTASVTTSSIF